MKINWFETYADTLMGGYAVDKLYNGDNVIAVGVEANELDKIIADLTEYKDFAEFNANYDCDDSDDIIHYMQDYGGTIYYDDDEDSIDIRLMKTWHNGNLRIKTYKDSEEYIERKAYA